jgi:hypothetical protein
MARFCPNCGTEVDETAVFCPTCGQPIDQAMETEIPPAPAWPDPPQQEPRAERAAEPFESTEPARWTDDDVVPARVEHPTRVEDVPPPSPGDGAAQRPMPPPPPAAADRRQSPQVNLPVTWPVTLSAWLIGVGAFVAAVGVVVGLFRGAINPIDLLVILLLVAIAVTVFFSTNVPAIPHLRLATFVVVLIGVGIAIDRIGFGGAGIGELLLFLGTAAAAIGCILVELGRDQPLGGPRS